MPMPEAYELIVTTAGEGARDAALSWIRFDRVRQRA
jgi:hypothetical protein